MYLLVSLVIVIGFFEGEVVGTPQKTCGPGTDHKCTTGTSSKEYTYWIYGTVTCKRETKINDQRNGRGARLILYESNNMAGGTHMMEGNGRNYVTANVFNPRDGSPRNGFILSGGYDDFWMSYYPWIKVRNAHCGTSGEDEGSDRIWWFKIPHAAQCVKGTRDRKTYTCWVSLELDLDGESEGTTTPYAGEKDEHRIPGGTRHSGNGEIKKKQKQTKKKKEEKQMKKKKEEKVE